MSDAMTRWIREYAEKQTFQPASVTALKAMNYLLAIQTAVVGLLLLGPADLFLQPASPPDAVWLAPTIGGFDIWEIFFLFGAAYLVIATSLLKGVGVGHILLAIFWLSFGIVWVIGGIISSPSYLFGVGVFGIFIGLQHVAMTGIWKAEGV